MNPFLTAQVPPEQRGFMKHRQFKDNVVELNAHAVQASYRPPGSFPPIGLAMDYGTAFVSMARSWLLKMLVSPGWPHFIIGLFHFAVAVIPLGGYWVLSFII
eukprot:7922799-Pyramimonas_sp.AAC.1